MASSQTPLLGTENNGDHQISNQPSSSNYKPVKSSSSTLTHVRQTIRSFLISKYSHYFVIILVTVDVASIFAKFLIDLHTCEHPKSPHRRLLLSIEEVLEVFSLIISCTFMAELLCSIYVFGPAYFKSKFHCFDAATIVASFLVDVLLHGPLEEAGALVIVLRLFRVFKIIEEGSDVAMEGMEGLEERVREMEVENERLEKEGEELHRLIEQLRVQVERNVEDV